MRVHAIAESEFERAFKQSAQYNRNSEYYCQRYNVADCYAQYISDVHVDLRVVWSTGHSYQHKNEFLFALDVKAFKEKYPDVYAHFMGYVVSAFDKFVQRESSPVLYIPMIVPSTEHINSETYKLVNEVARMCVKNGYVVVTDAPLRRDFEIFGRNTKSSSVNINGMQYYIWR